MLKPSMLKTRIVNVGGHDGLKELVKPARRKK